MKIPWRRVLIVTGASFGGLVAIVVARTVMLTPQTAALPPGPSIPAFEAAAVAEHLAGAIQIPTISHEDRADNDPTEFARLHAYLAERFPQMRASLEREIIGGSSLLYRWPGSDAALRPLVLMAHLDVVPVEPGTQDAWTQPAFSGAITDGFVWGRGALDVKLGVVAQHAAVEALLGAGFVPKRTVLFAYGHDEEVGGDEGAGVIAETLRSRGVEPAMVVDEGGAVVEGTIPGLAAPAALVGVSEKGYVTLELIATADGGHSSMPPEHTSIGTLSAAITRLEGDPFPAQLPAPTRMMFEHLGPHLSFGGRMVAANVWIFERLMRGVLASKPATAAVVRTTTAVTVIEGGTKANLLPAQARALVNHRTLPGDDVESVRARVQSIIDDDRISVTVNQGRDATTVSATEGPEFESLSRAIRWTFPDAVVAPYLVVGGTDARHFDGTSPAVYRFLPIHMLGEDRKRMHGTNERISVHGTKLAAEFYARLITDYAG